MGRGHGFTVIDDIFDATPGREVIDAVRAAAENTRRPGTFLLTSSSDPHREGADATGLEGWTVAVPLLGLSRGEFLGRQDDLVTAVLEGALESTTSAPTPTGRQELLARGSYPGLGATDPSDPCDTAGWYRDYLTDLVTRDVPSLVDVDDPFRIHTYRNGSGRAADAILELRDGRVIAIQVPGENGTPTEDAASDLEFLRDNLGKRFIAGIIIGADGSAYRSLGERVWEVPLSVLWELNTLNTPNADPDGSPEE